jgi:hypothetical protein
VLVHASIQPIKAVVREDVLYDMDPSKAGITVPCQLVGVTSYKGSVPTFQIVVEGDSLFSYVPPHLVSTKLKDPAFDFSLKSLVYHNCPDVEFSLSVWDFLKDRQLSIFLKDLKCLTEGLYLFTLDWYTGNDLLHAIQLSNGQISFLPQHKILLNGSTTFKPYKKLHCEWSV